MNELIGSTILTIFLGTIVYFIIASKNRWGFDTTIAIGFPIILIMGMAFAGFSAIYAFATLLIGVMLGWIFQQIIRSRA